MNNTAISNPYNMQLVPREQTPIYVHVNGKRAVCHRCGRVPVKTVSSFCLGRIRTDESDEDGHRIYKPVSIDLCSICNSVIQHPAPEPAPKKAAQEGKVNPKIFALLAHLIHGEREGWRLAKLLEVSQPTVWTYLRELQRMEYVTIGKTTGRNVTMKAVDVTDAGRHHFDVERK